MTTAIKFACALVTSCAALTAAPAVADPISYDALLFGKSFHVGDHEACGAVQRVEPRPRR
ncbi:MAG: hypothetical protein WDN30_14330 [Pararobbsia sp.]